MRSFEMKKALILISLFVVACGTEGIISYGYPVVGPTGAKGDKGDPGENCTVQQAVNGALILCPDGSNVLVLNGEKGEKGDQGNKGDNGEDGQDASPSSYSIVAVIDPCGDSPNEFDEVIIRLADNSLIAYFEDGGKRFLASIPAGSYQTTDRQKCNFTVNANMTVTF
jgi:hypothetical protein